MLQVANNGAHTCPTALASTSRIWKAWPCHVSWVKVVLRGSAVGRLCIRPSSLDRGLTAGHALHVSVTVVLFSTPAGPYSTDKTVITPPAGGDPARHLVQPGWRLFHTRKATHPNAYCTQSSAQMKQRCPQLNQSAGFWISEAATSNSELVYNTWRNSILNRGRKVKTGPGVQAWDPGCRRRIRSSNPAWTT